MRTSDTAFDVGALLVSAGLLVATAFGSSGPPRMLLAITFVTFVPGWAFLDVAPLATGSVKVALAVLISLTTCSAAVFVLLWIRLWEPFVLLYAMGILSIIAVATHLLLVARDIGIFRDQAGGRGVLELSRRNPTT